MDIGQTGVTLNWELIAQVAGTPRGIFYRVKHPDTKSVQIARTISGRRYTFPEGLQFDRPVAAVITQFEQNSESFTIYDIPACHTLYEVLKTFLRKITRHAVFTHFQIRCFIFTSWHGFMRQIRYRQHEMA